MKKLNKKLLLVAILGMLTFGVAGCIKPYDTPELVTIEANQTAFLIPLVGDTNDQASFESEELLAQARVATKEIQIPHRWVQTGRWKNTGEWRAAAKLIVVDRTPVTREWNSSKDGGTSSQNQAIYAESKESIGFSIGMNISAQIYTEQDAVTFLYSYNNMPLTSIMDTEIRSMVETEFVEACANYTLNEILQNKESILKTVRDEVIPYFREKGITITVLGMKDGIEYDDQAIQQAINEKFSSEQKLVTQQNENAVALAKAEADATAIKIKAEAEAEAAKIKAENDAEVAKITANAEAEVIRIQSEAEATANKKISESLTDYIIQKMHADNERIMWENWNGITPYIFGADNINPFLNMGE